MHISSLEIRNFRGIKHLEVQNLKMVNIFLGKNNVGKTTLLEAVFISLAAGNPQTIVNIDTFRNLLHTNPEDFKFPFYQLDYNNIIEIETEYSDDGFSKALKISPLIQNTILLQASARDSADSSTSTNNKDLNLVNGLELKYSFKKRHSKQEHHTTKIEIDSNNVFKQTPGKYIETTRGVILPVNMAFGQLSSRLEKVIINKRENELVEYLKAVDSSIVGITLGINNVILCDTGFGKRYPINLLGDGFLKLISILLAIYDLQGGIVLVDEFSNGLHYTALDGLWRAIFKAAKDNNVQIFLTTHDYEVLSHLKDLLLEPDFSVFQNEVMSYTLRKLPNGNSKSYNYDFYKIEGAIADDNEIR